MKRVVLAGLLAIAAAPSTAQAAPPQLLSPPDGAVLPSTADIPFTARAERFSAPMVVIANRPDLNPGGAPRLRVHCGCDLHVSDRRQRDPVPSRAAATGPVPARDVLLAGLRRRLDRRLAGPLVHASAGYSPSGLPVRASPESAAAPAERPRPSQPRPSPPPHCEYEAPRCSGPCPGASLPAAGGPRLLSRDTHRRSSRWPCRGA